MIGQGSTQGGRTVLTALARGWIAVIGIGIAFAAGGLAYSLLQKPTYEATSIVYVTSGTITSTSAYDSMKASQERVVTYAQLMYTDAVLATALKTSGVDRSLDDLRSAVRVEINPQITMMTLSVTDHDPAIAQKLATGVSQGLTRAAAKLDQPPGGGAATSRVSTVTPATVSPDPIAPDTLMIVGLTAAVGLIVGVLTVLALEMFNNRVRDSADATAALGARVLAAVPQRAESALPGDDPRAALAFRELCADLLASGQDGPVRSVLVTSARGSNEQSTVVSNIAAGLASVGESVAIVDAWLARSEGDHGRSSLGAHAARSAASLTGYLLNGNSPLGELRPTNVDGVFLLPASSSNDGDRDYEVAKVGSKLASPKFEHLVDSLCARYRFVVIDSPPVLDEAETVVMASFADRSIFIAEAGASRISELRACRDKLDAVGVALSGSVLYVRAAD